MTDKGRSLVEAAHRAAIERLAGQPLPEPAQATIHYTELPEAKAGEALGREWNTYRREAGRLLAEGHDGKYVLIKEEMILGFFDSEDTARAEGSKRFPRQPFLVHQIREREPLLRIRGCNLPCPSSPTPLAKPA
jgi:hypothetical protein